MPFTRPMKLAAEAHLGNALGNLKSSTGSTTNPYQYVGSLGYHKDATSGLLHLGRTPAGPGAASP